MPADRISIKEATGHTGAELVEMAEKILDGPSDRAAEIAEEVGAPAGALVFTFMALSTEEGDSRFGVMPIKSVWVLSGGLDEDAEDAPLSTNGEKAWAQNVLGTALARRIPADDERGRAAYLRELLASAAQLADVWGYEISMVGMDSDVRPRSRTSRTVRPSGRGGRSPRQRRKR